jgi:hypothetical protein
MMLRDFKVIKFANRGLYWLTTDSTYSASRWICQGNSLSGVRCRNFHEENVYSQEHLYTCILFLSVLNVVAET